MLTHMQVAVGSETIDVFAMVLAAFEGTLNHYMVQDERTLFVIFSVLVVVDL